MPYLLPRVAVVLNHDLFYGALGGLLIFLCYLPECDYDLVHNSLRVAALSSVQNVGINSAVCAMVGNVTVMDYSLRFFTKL